jgi:hypothetical protein
LKNVDYQSSNLELEELGPSPDKSRTARLVNGDSDTDFAAAVESGVDEDYQAPILGATNPQVRQKKERRVVSESGPVPNQVRQGMAKNKPLKSQKSNTKGSSGEKPITAQKKVTFSRATPIENGTSPARVNDSKSKNTALLLAGEVFAQEPVSANNSL